MNQQHRETIKSLVKDRLDKAESIWSIRGAELTFYDTESANNRMFESVSSPIPGYANVTDETNDVANFIALVADMRESSKHLLCEISTKNAKVSMLQRVYYETAALLPAMAQAISYQEGAVTEYLGDGVLALFKVDENNPNKAIYAAHSASKHCINVCREIVNEELKERYNLPPLDIGVGLAYSKALVTLMGLDDFKHAKAFGECVFRATKLSHGKNQIYTDKKLRAMWPKSKTGEGLTFKKIEHNGVEGFLIQH